MSNSDFLETEHDGDTGRVIYTGFVSGDKTLCRLFQPQNLPRPTHKQHEVDAAIIAPKDHRIDDLEDALQLAVRAIQNLLPGGVNHPQANHGLVNEAILTARALLRAEKPDA